ncbi:MULTISPECIES: TauD/TfdA dioxygenase family protein [Phenylobacterium]|uniref:Taurine dioxygenase n=1 Tax=Phenylobacterium koreense TaxID=266125 RepID=A0ABV2EGQ6_9CAUL
MTALVRDTDGCGAEITQVAVADATDSEIDLIRETVFRRGVAFLHDQHLTPEEHIAFAERIGPIVVNRYFPPSERYPQIAKVEKTEAQTTNIGGGWHTDHSYDQAPAMGSVLLAIETPPSGGDTLFADMYGAYEALSDGLKATLAGLRALHASAHIYGKDGVFGRTDQAHLAGHDDTPSAIHPAVITHPGSGRKALYVNPAFTLGFEGWTAEESRALLGYLYQHAVQPQFVHRFAWKPGSMAIWDNRATWHQAMNDYQGHRRLMHRITIAGEPLGA